MTTLLVNEVSQFRFDYRYFIENVVCGVNKTVSKLATDFFLYRYRTVYLPTVLLLESRRVQYLRKNVQEPLVLTPLYLGNDSE